MRSVSWKALRLGVMAVNLNMHSDGEGSINAHLCDTIASVFPHVYTADVPGATNRELFAWCGEEVLDTFQANIAAVRKEVIALMSQYPLFAW